MVTRRLPSGRASVLAALLLERLQPGEIAKQDTQELGEMPPVGKQRAEGGVPTFVLVDPANLEVQREGDQPVRTVGLEDDKACDRVKLECSGEEDRKSTRRN